MQAQQRCSLFLGLCLSLGLPCAFAETRLSQTPWGSLDDGTPVTLHTLTNASGARASFMPLGAAIVEVQVPDRDGRLADVVLGFDNAAAYRSANGAYMGLTIGRYASRIFGTDLELNGTTHTLVAQPTRDGSAGTVILHGGPDGFSNRLWSASRTDSSNGDGIRYTLVSPDGDQGFPGEMTVSVTYHWSDDFRLSVSYEATTNKTTVVNLTQHSYFNLAGAGNGDILQHTLQVNADFFTFALPDNRVTGEIISVRDTPFDFTTAKVIGRDIDSDDPQMLANRGYNQNFVLRRSPLPGTLAEAAVLHEPVSGRRLAVWTTEPGLFLYTGNFIDTRQTMKGGVTYPLRAGVALETGHFPDSPNQRHFPRTTLLPGAVFSSQTIFAFSLD